MSRTETREPTSAVVPPRDWNAIRAVVRKDVTAMLAVPVLLLVVLPLAVGIAARAQTGGIERFLADMPAGLRDPITSLPAPEQLLVLVNGYLLAPLFLIVPLMVSAVLAADAFAGEKERRTMESLLHLPISNRDLFVAKLLGAYVPALAVSWIGFLLFCVVSNAIGWPVMGRIFVPTRLWIVVIFWVAPAVALLGLGVMVRVSVRARSTQEANQLGGAVVLPLIFLAVGQSTGLLLVDLPIAVAIGAVVWLIAIWLTARGARRFTRDELATRI